jgi:C-terminal processing protease CtpA/Prc
VIKYLDGELGYYSKGYEKINLNNYKVYLLGNNGSASASEIMIGTMKDYFPNIIFV